MIGRMTNRQKVEDWLCAKRAISDSWYALAQIENGTGLTYSRVSAVLYGNFNDYFERKSNLFSGRAHGERTGWRFKKETTA